MHRRILHIDMDAFFASVEAALNPSLWGKPLIVGGHDDARSVVSSASYEARKFGVRSAMPMAQARKLCPKGIFIPCSHGVYGETSRRIQEMLESVSPCIQMASIDEANLDITGSIHLFGDEAAVAAHIKSRIVEQEHITATVGIASNKMVAKIAANACKPDGYLSVPSGMEREFLAPLPVGVLPGVGPRTGEVLEQMGILTVKQLADTPENMLKRLLGEQAAGYLHAAALGAGSDNVEPYQPPKSISRETTFSQDQADWNAIEPVLFHLAEHCAYTMRSEGFETRRITLKVRYSDFETKTFAHTLSEPTALDGAIIQALRELLPKAKARRARVRLIGVNLSSLTRDLHQMQLFEKEQDEKWERVLRSVDTVRSKLGFESVNLGGALQQDNKAKPTRKKKSGPA